MRQQDLDSSVWGVCSFIVQVFNLLTSRLWTPPSLRRSLPVSAPVFKLMTVFYCFLNSWLNCSSHFLLLEVWGHLVCCPRPPQRIHASCHLDDVGKPANLFLIVQQGVSCSCWLLTLWSSEGRITKGSSVSHTARGFLFRLHFIARHFMCCVRRRTPAVKMPQVQAGTEDTCRRGLIRASPRMKSSVWWCLCIPEFNFLICPVTFGHHTFYTDGCQSYTIKPYLDGNIHKLKLKACR